MMFNGTDPQQKVLLDFDPPMQEIQPGVIYLVRNPDKVSCMLPSPCIKHTQNCKQALWCQNVPKYNVASQYRGSASHVRL